MAKKKKMQQEIAGRLLLLRERKFGNASEMARSVKLTPQRWYNYETGRRALDVDVAARVVQEHGVDFNWLYGGTLDSLKEQVRNLILHGDPKQAKLVDVDIVGAIKPARKAKAKVKAKPKRKAAKHKPPHEDNNGADPHR